MTIVSLEDLIIAQETLTQRIELLEAGHSDLVEALTEARETINSLGNLVESSHKVLIARITQLERKARRLDNQQATVPGMVTRLIAGERQARTLTSKVDKTEADALDLDIRLSELEQAADRDISPTQ